jgi:predicted subunit of tRNA(5-methylaminomethyl-2-thiouridylate) methyltransferase
MRENKKALVMFSGGLDSLLAVRTLQEQDITVHAICFSSNFFSCAGTRKIAEVNGITIREEVDISDEILELVKDTGVKKGKNLNPCIDCHALMARKAKKYVESGEYDLLASGEVLGQRPLSQVKKAMREVEKKAEIEILRPLSAKNLESTEAEKRGDVDRDRLLDIRGRGRKKQVELTIYYNLKGYESPSGGCLLTESEFSQKLKKMIKYWPGCDESDVDLLKYGRAKWFKRRDGHGEEYHILVVIGRKDEDNVCLKYSQKEGDVVISLRELTGPLALVRSKAYECEIREEVYDLDIPHQLDIDYSKSFQCENERELFEQAALMTAWHKPRARGRTVGVEVTKK